MIEDRIFSVYIHKFPNKKQYVGITSVKPKKRWKKGYGYKRNKQMFDDILEYGWDNIEHILFNDEGILYTEEEACYIENNLIKSWDLTNQEKGYNLMSGGVTSYLQHKTTKAKIALSNNIPVVQYSLDGNKMAEFISALEASKQLNVNNKNIASCCKGKRKTANGYIWRYKSDNLESVNPQLKFEKKPVVQYSINGTKIAEYSSIEEAKRKTNVNSVCIIQCCKGNNKTAGNYLWRYKSDNLESVNPQSTKQKPVIQYSLDGIIIKEFNSITEASKNTNISITHIWACCNKKTNCSSFIWKYKEMIMPVLD